MLHISSISVVVGTEKGVEALQPDPLGDAPALADAAAQDEHDAEKDQAADDSQLPVPKTAGEEPAELDALGDAHPTSPMAAAGQGSILDRLPQELAGDGHPAALMFDAAGSVPANCVADGMSL